MTRRNRVPERSPTFVRASALYDLESGERVEWSAATGHQDGGGGGGAP